MSAVEFRIHIRTQTECNTGGSKWEKIKRAKTQRKAAWLPCYVLDRVEWCGPKPPLGLERGANIKGALAPFVSVTVPLTVTMTRVSPRALDSFENLPSSMKHIVDGIADALDIDDRDHRITWKVEQERGLPEQHDVIVRIEPTPEAEWKPAPMKKGRKRRAA